MKVEEKVADYVVPEKPKENVGRVRYEAETHQTKIMLLGDVCKTTSGGTPSRKHAEYFLGSIPWVKSGELPDGPVVNVEEAISDDALRNSSAKLFPAGTLLIALYGATVGKLGILTRPAATNQAVCAIFPSERIDTKFLFWFLRFRRSDLVAQAIGGAQPNISQGIIRNIEIPVPSLGQQTRIVAEIEKQFSRLDEAVANLKRVKANIKRYKAAVLKAAVEGRLVETEAELARREGRSYETGAQLLQCILEARRSQWKGKGKYKEPAAPDTTDLPELPEGWALASLEQLTSSERVICYGILMPKENVSNGVLYVKVRDLKGDKVNLSALQRTAPEIAAKYARASLRTGDILLAIRGTYGRIAEVPPELDGGNITQDTARLAVSPLVDKNYVAWFLRSQDAQNYFKRVARGVAVKGVNIADVRLCPIFLPSLPEQRRIVAEVDRHLTLANEAEAQVNANLQRAERLRQSILQRAFTTPCVDKTLTAAQ